jgi:hypothetical protein
LVGTIFVGGFFLFLLTGFRGQLYGYFDSKVLFLSSVVIFEAGSADYGAARPSLLSSSAERCVELGNRHLPGNDEYGIRCDNGSGATDVSWIRRVDLGYWALVNRLTRGQFPAF